MTPTITRSWRLARAATAALALTAAALTVSGAAPGAGASSTTAATAAAPCLSVPSDHRVRAGSGLEGVDPNSLATATAAAAERRLDARVEQHRTSQRAALGRTRIDVYVHVITKSNGKGGVSTKRVKRQIAALNEAYAGGTSSSSTSTPFYFKLKKINKTKKTSWYNWDTPTKTSVGDDVAPKKKLHRGNAGDLNLYIAKPTAGTLGYSSFPWSGSLKRDGVVVLNSSLPGGSSAPYDLGDTAVHEVGHWLGLLHTFQDGCGGTGDYVDDTPAQDDGPNIYYCNEFEDSCQASEGLDPVHNFMSYGDDLCLDRFSAGQVDRMEEAWQAYRAPGAGA